MKITVYKVRYHTITTAQEDLFDVSELDHDVTDEFGQVRDKKGLKVRTLRVAKGAEVSRTSPEQVLVAGQSWEEASSCVRASSDAGVNTVILSSQVVCQNVAFQQAAKPAPKAVVTSKPEAEDTDQKDQTESAEE